MRYLLEDAILASLTAGTAERYELAEVDLPRLVFLFRRVADRPTSVEEFFRVLQLAVAFEETLDSPTVAARLRALAKEGPAVLALLRKRLGRAKAMDETRRFLRSEGREVVLRAPGPPGPWKRGKR